MPAVGHLVDLWIVTKSIENYTDTVLGEIVAPTGT